MSPDEGDAPSFVVASEKYSTLSDMDSGEGGGRWFAFISAMSFVDFDERSELVLDPDGRGFGEDLGLFVSALLL